MEKETLESIRMDIYTKIYQVNQNMLNVMASDKKVIEALKIVDENNKIVQKIKEFQNKICLLRNNCSHDLLLYKDYSFQMYDSYYCYQCIECGASVESSFKMNNVIKSERSFNELRNEYYKYLFEYDVGIAIEIMLAKYSNEIFSFMVKERGVDEAKVLKLLKLMESDGRVE